MMLWKCCTQYASKFGKLSSGHRTGKGQFSFQSQKRATPKNVQTTTQLHSFHMQARWHSKSFKLGCNSMWTKNFQMYKINLGKEEEPEITLPISTGSQKKQESSSKCLLLLQWQHYSLYCVDHSKLWKILKRWDTRPPYLPPEKPVCRLRSNS